MTKIEYIKGDATLPTGAGQKVICHICNDVGGWGAGFVLAISKKWKEPEAAYREWYKTLDGFDLGRVQLVQVEEDIFVANMIGQHGIRPNEHGVPPIRYDAVSSCLRILANGVLNTGASVHMPRIGCGLAGGKWECIEPLIVQHLCSKGIQVYVYDL